MADWTASAVPSGFGGGRQHPMAAHLDRVLLGVIVALAALGLVAVASASVSVADQAVGDPFYFLKRQTVFLMLGGGLLAALVHVPLSNWYHAGPGLMLAALALLILVLVPGVGREVNGAVRWIPLGVFNLQVAEAAKVLLTLYLAGYLVRRREALGRSTVAFLIPMGVFAVAAFLLLAQPDFGTGLLIMGLAMAMLFLAGVSLWRFAALLGVLAAGAAALIFYSPYRWERVTAFMDPWSDPFNTGFQLTQSLIAVGRGEWFGVGIGNSVQKLFYLPEAHTDFVFSVWAEELGLLGVAVVLLLFGVLAWRALELGRACHRHGLGFPGYVAWGAGLGIALQAFINVGVALGALPTKGLTLPLFSYGGSSALATGALLGLLLRASVELGQAREDGRRPPEEGA